MRIYIGGGRTLGASKPMVQIMSDPRMKATFEAMLKDPALQPLAKEALNAK